MKVGQTTADKQAVGVGGLSCRSQQHKPCVTEPDEGARHDDNNTAPG